MKNERGVANALARLARNCSQHNFRPCHNSYSGPTAAFAYTHLNDGALRIQRVFVIGPSHHVYLKCVWRRCDRSIRLAPTLLITFILQSLVLHTRACAVSGASVCETPVGDLQVQQEEGP